MSLFIYVTFIGSLFVMENTETIHVNFKILGNSAIESLDLPSDCGLETLKVLVSDFCQIPIDDIRILFKGRAFRATDTLQTLGVKNDDTIIVVPQRKNPPPAAADPPTPAPAAPAPGPSGNAAPAASPAPQPQNQRVEESAEKKELRKKLAQLQKVITTLNSQIVDLQAKLSDQNTQIPQEIQNLKQKVEESTRKLQELSQTLNFESAPANSPAQPVPEPEPVDPDSERLAERPPPLQNPGRPNLPINDILGSLFGGGQNGGNNANTQAPQTQQQGVFFTPQQMEVLNADIAKMNSEGYIKPLNETYRATEIYGHTKV